MIRPVNKMDFDRAHEIYCHPAINPYMNFEVLPKEQFTEIFTELLRQSFFFAYENDSKTMGFCTVARQPRRASHVGTIGSLAMDPRYQKRGAGVQFMIEVFDELKRNGIFRVDLMVEDDNERAIGFYKKLGFEQEGRLTKYFKRGSDPNYVTEILMAKFLT